ncbi:MAG: DUF1127 domain-containing protein [Janthinobacterium lividum]
MATIRRRRWEHALSRLSDDGLKDMGLTRGNIRYRASREHGSAPDGSEMHSLKGISHERECDTEVKPYEINDRCMARRGCAKILDEALRSADPYAHLAGVQADFWQAGRFGDVMVVALLRTLHQEGELEKLLYIRARWAAEDQPLLRRKADRPSEGRRVD